MDNLQHIITGGGITGAAVIFLALHYQLKKEFESRFVNRDTCHTAQDAIKDRIEKLEQHISNRFDDLKDFISVNGHKKDI